MLIAQVTDTHIRANGAFAFGGQVDTSAGLRRAVRYIRELDPQPDVILATGDLVDSGRADDYAQLRSLLAPLGAPIFAIPGNHDARAPLREAFPEVRRRVTGEHIQYVVDDFPVRLIAIDTLDEGQIGGRLCAARLEWIGEALARSPRPTLLFMHHPPYDYGAQPNADMHCAGAEALAPLVARHGNVIAVLCGHLHRWTHARWAGTLACTAPATAPVLQLNLSGRAPDGWIDSPPMVGLHLWRATAGLVSHTIDVDEPGQVRAFGAPVPPPPENSMHKRHNPPSLFPSPAYTHGIEVAPGARTLHVSGQIGRASDGSIVSGFRAQLDLAWQNVLAVLAQAGMGLEDVVKVTEYLVRPEHVAECRAKRAQVYGENHRPATTLVVVQQLALPEMLIEIEVVAAKAP